MSSIASKNSLPLAISLVGSKYKNGGSNPEDGFDCWGLYWHFLTKLGLDIPNDYIYEGRATPKSLINMTTKARESDGWHPLTTPSDLCLVAFGRGDAITHVGVWIEGAKSVLHATREFGVVCETLIEIRRNRNLKHKFYKWHIST